jgi:gliding motility-associated-like protein
LDTGCYTPPQQDPVTFEVDLSFELYVKEGAFAGTPDPYMICDNLAPSDGLAEFTLIPNAALPTDLDPQAQLLVDQILQGQDPSVYVLTFHETLSDAELGVGNLPDVYTNITNPQVIYARVSNLLDPNDVPICYGVAEVLLAVEQLPPMILEDEYRICVDAQGNAIMEDFGAVSPPTLETGLPTEGFTFLWSLNGTILPNEVGPSLVALAPGSYSVLVTELASGCSLETVVAVNPASPPLEYNVRLLNGAFAGEHVIEATATGLGAYQFSLDGGNLQDSGVFENVTPGTHQVTITNVEGCGSITVDIGVVDYPRFVTPNNDGFNDTWNIIGLADYDPAARIYIFDRYGKLLKQLSPTSAGWDGTYKGNPLPSSDYWFRIEYTEEDIPKAFTGHFTLKR